MEITFIDIKENPSAYITEFGVHGIQDKACIIMLNGSARYFNEGQKLVREGDKWKVVKG